MKAVLCCEPAQEVMRTGWNPVIIDNTNVQAWQMLPYVRLVCHSPHFLHYLLSPINSCVLLVDGCIKPVKDWNSY